MSFTRSQLFHGFAAFTVDRTMRQGKGPANTIAEWASLPAEERKVWIAIAFSARYGTSAEEEENEPTHEELEEVLGWITDAWEKGMS